MSLWKKLWSTTQQSAMKSIIKNVALASLFFCSFISNAQVSADKSLDKFPDRIFAADLFIQSAMPSGDNFIGNGLSNGIGYGLRLQFDVYNNIYVGGSLTQDFFDVENTQLIGEFSRATKFNAYLFAGYDYVINDDWNITGDLGYGYSQNKNRQNSFQGGGKFKDTGNVLRLTTSLEHTFSSGVSVYVSPSYEKVFYNIDTAPALGSNFDTGNYFNLALGFRFNSRDYRNVPLGSSDNEQLQELLSRDRDDLSIKEKRALYFLKKREARKQRRERRKKN